MQVNSVQSSPNFGMALRIRPEALETLKTMKRSQIEGLQQIAEELKDTKHYHLEIGKDAERTIVSPYANKYVGGSFTLKEPHDEFLEFEATWAGTESNGVKKGERYKSCIECVNKEAAKDVYENINKEWGIDRDVKMVKYLDAREIAKQAEYEAARKEQSEIRNMVDELFNKYGVGAK